MLGFPLVPVLFVFAVVADSSAKVSASESESEDADAVNQEYVLARPPVRPPPSLLAFLAFFLSLVARRRRFLPES